jgi:uncharacterized protein
MEDWDLIAPVRQRATLAEVDHRPWALPPGRPVMGQTWRRLLFAHWRFPPDELRAHVPPPLELDLYDGAAWLGVTPFVITGLRATATPPFPLLSAFPELNVRTYVDYGGKPGIFFFSLDAGSRLAVIAARRFYRLPYFVARMSEKQEGDSIRYESRRNDERGHAARFRVTYAPRGAPKAGAPGTLEAFLAERYCLYTVHEGLPFRAEIHHPPWPLQPADAEIEENSMPPLRMRLPTEPPLLHFAERQDVLIWALAQADADD